MAKVRWPPKFKHTLLLQLSELRNHTPLAVKMEGTMLVTRHHSITWCKQSLMIAMTSTVLATQLLTTNSVAGELHDAVRANNAKRFTLLLKAGPGKNQRARTGEKVEKTKPFSVAIAKNFRFMSAFFRMWILVSVVSVMCESAFAADTSVVASGAKVEKLAEGFSFTDGPAADVHGNVFFTDNLRSRIVKWNAEDATISDWLKPAGRAVGTYFDKAGNLIVAASEKGEIWSIAPDRTISVFVTNFNGKAFYGPNDLWFRPDGGIYFTDPELYTSRDPSKRVDIQGVYFVTPDRKTVKPVETDFLKPGGIIGTPDGKTLYITDFIVDETYAYDITPDGALTNKRLFCKLNARGMTIDSEGNLYLVRFGVTVFDKFGKKLEHIDIPQKVTNITFGGKEKDFLIIAAAGTIYSLKMRVKGAR